MAVTSEATHSMIRHAIAELGPRHTYQMLRYYYENNGLYDRLFDLAKSVGAEAQAMRPLRNPANRVVEFYATHLWPGALPDALPINAVDESILEPVQQIWAWSNWGAQKQVAARWFACDGDWFAKVVLRRDGDVPKSVYIQNIQAEFVTDFTEDERGYLTYLRIDVPKLRHKDNGETESYTYSEVWEKADTRLRIWEHEYGASVNISQMGKPITDIDYLEAYDFDFIPIAHAKFRDMGDKRGWGSFTHAIDKIDEVNRITTRLHQMLWRYNKTFWALRANTVDAAGRPMPAPIIEKNSDDKVDFTDEEEWIRLPGNSSLEGLVPSIDYAAALSVVDAMITDMERDLPEMAYHRIVAKVGLSGTAIRLMMAEAIDKVLEARGSAETALVRLHQMALTIGKNAKLFTDVPDYESGKLAHDFEERDVISLDEVDTMAVVKVMVETGVPLATALKRAGWSETDIEQMVIDQQAELAAGQNSLAMALIAQQKEFDRNAVGGGNGND